MINGILTNSLLDSNNRFYTASNIVSTVALFALKKAASLSFLSFTALAMTTLVFNYSVFDAIATSPLSNKKKFIPLQILLIGLIVLGSSATNVIFIAPVFFLSKILYPLINAKISFCIADLPLYMLLLSLLSSPIQTSSKILDLFKDNITIHNRLLQELRPLNCTSNQSPLIEVTSTDCFQFVVSFLLEAITRGIRDGVDFNENTIVFEHSPILAPYLITHINESTQPILNPSRFLELSEYLEALPRGPEFEEDYIITFQNLLIEFQRLSIDLQKRHCNKILEHYDLQSIMPDDLKLILQEYQNTHIHTATDVDAIMSLGISFNKEMLDFAKKEPHLQTVDTLQDIMGKYNSLQNSLRESLSCQPENTNGRKRITSLINSLYFLYEKNIIPIRFQFPDDSSNDDMEQPAWNYLANKFPCDFFENLPTHLFSNRQDSDTLDQDFKKYKISTAGEFITKVFNDNIATFQASRKEEVIEKLINYCTNNCSSNRYKVQLIKIQYEAHKIIKISTAIFTSIIAPLLTHPIEFGMGSVYAIITKRKTPRSSIDSVSTSLFQGFLLSISSFGGLWAGRQFTGRYIVPLLE